MMGEILVADDIEVVYGARKGLFGGAKSGVKVLHGVSLRIGRGETVGIVGESGSGKTTLGRALLRLPRGTPGGRPRAGRRGARGTRARGRAVWRLVGAAAEQTGFDGAEITCMPEAAMRPLRRRM